MSFFKSTRSLALWVAIIIPLLIMSGCGPEPATDTSSSSSSSNSSSSSSNSSSSSGTTSTIDPQELPNITVWLAGDSTMANGQTPCPAGWGKYLHNYFSDKVSVRNSAAGGRSVRTWLYDVFDTKAPSGECNIGTTQDGSSTLQDRWKTMLNEMKAGDYLLVQFGINDGSPTCPRHVGSQAFKDAFSYMTQEAIERGVKPIFITPVSAIRCNGSVAVATRGFLTETFDIGNSTSTPVLDLHEKSIELYNQSGFCPAPGNNASTATTQPGPIGDFFCNDHTHFANSGADRIAHAVAELIQDTNIPLSLYLKNL